MNYADLQRIHMLNLLSFRRQPQNDKAPAACASGHGGAPTAARETPWDHQRRIEQAIALNEVRFGCACLGLDIDKFPTAADDLVASWDRLISQVSIEHVPLPDIRDDEFMSRIYYNVMAQRMTRVGDELIASHLQVVRSAGDTVETRRAEIGYGLARLGLDIDGFPDTRGQSALLAAIWADLRHAFSATIYPDTGIGLMIAAADPVDAASRFCVEAGGAAAVACHSFGVRQAFLASPLKLLHNPRPKGH